MVMIPTENCLKRRLSEPEAFILELFAPHEKAQKVLIQAECQVKSNNQLEYIIIIRRSRRRTKKKKKMRKKQQKK